MLLKIKQMQETLTMLDYKKWYYETAKTAGTCSIHQDLGKEDILPELWDMREKAKGLINSTL